ncbi:CehA/McbA family metallohydrolase [Pyrodictium delaneyi]|nr:CehA/McbA family metallohydrolase [Pyrodictium delaneyi]
MWALLLLVLAALSAVSPLTAAASSPETGAKIIVGPTPIPEGEANGEHDITLMNQYLAVTFGISTSPPWGVPRGFIVDAAPVENGEILQDTLAQFSFLANGWGRWPKIDLESIEYGSNETGVWLREVGYWETLKVEITFYLPSDKPYLVITAEVTNTGDKALENLVQGFAMSLERGWTFSPGFGTGKHYKPTPLAELGIPEDAKWVVGYHKDYTIGLIAPYYTHLSTSTSWVDPLTIATIQPGETRVYTAKLVFLPEPNSCAVAAEAAGETGTVAGTVAAGGEPVAPAYIVAFLSTGKPFCWGYSEKPEYTIALPSGSYALQAWAEGYGPSSKHSVTVEVGAEARVDFTDLKPSGKLILHIRDADTGRPLDAAVLPEGGEKPPLMFLGSRIFYTLPEKQGEAIVELAPGVYNITVNHAGGFLAKPVVLTNVEVKPGETIEKTVEVKILVDPNQYGYYCADLHHHSDIADGRTPPPYLVVAQSAAGLDFAFVSDHDSVANQAEIAKWAETRGMPFIPSIEVSPGWGHFNPYPVTRTINKDTPESLIEDAWEAGALVIRVNHPFRGGYWESWLDDKLPGIYNPFYTNVEINGRWDKTDNQTVTLLWKMWSNNIRYYLTAGSDTHDIWSGFTTGSPRVCAYLGRTATVEAFAMAERHGHTFITYGPMVFMYPLPGSTIAPEDGKIVLELDLWAVNGLKKLVVVANGKPVKQIQFNGEQHRELALELPAEEVLATPGQPWVQVIVYDTAGKLAMTNPVWIDTTVKSLAMPETVETTTVTVTTTLVKTDTVTHTATVTQPVTKTATTTVTTTETSTITSEKIVEKKVTVGGGAATAAPALILGVVIGAAIAYLMVRRAS